jgi:hypothetical protein
MVLIRATLLMLLALGLLAPSPISAHENHQKARAEAAKTAAPADASLPPSETQPRMEAPIGEMEAQRPKTFGERLAGWLGRMHRLPSIFRSPCFPWRSSRSCSPGVGAKR